MDQKIDQAQRRISENQKLLTPQQKEEIKKAFDFFDVTGSGTIVVTNRYHRSKKSQSRSKGTGFRPFE